MHIPWPVPFFKSKYDKTYNDDEDGYEEDYGEDDDSYENRGRYGRSGYRRNYGQKSPRSDYNNNKYQTSKYNNRRYDDDNEDSYGAKNYGRPKVVHGDNKERNYVGNYNDDSDPSNYERRRTRKTYGNSGRGY